LRFSIVIFLLLFAGCDQLKKHLIDDPNIICDTDNLVRDGAWFGRHTNKIARYENTVFTYIMPNDEDHRHIILYKRIDGQLWEKGISIPVSRPPDLILDSKGHVHVIGHRLFDDSSQSDGRLFHIVFKDSMDIAQKHTFEFITPDWRLNMAPETYATYYSGATIDKNDMITVVYCNSATNSQYPSLASVSYDSNARKWQYASVSDSMSSRLCYPYVVNGASQQHIVSVEDQYDSALENTGYPYRYGKVEYLFRPNEADEWKSETLFNLNGEYSKADIAKSILRVSDVLYDSNDTLHVLLRMNELEKSNISLNLFLGTKVIYLRKHELDTLWVLTELPFTDYPEPRMWECPNGKVVLVGVNNVNSSLELVAVSSFLKRPESGFASYRGSGSFLFLRTNRNTTLYKSHVFDFIVYDGSTPTPAKAGTNLYDSCLPKQPHSITQ
jgi:hypothetical protein